MKFGKLASIEGVDFALPADPAINAVCWENLTPIPDPKGYIGCTGWGMQAWVGEWYPKGTKSKDFLRAYGEQFNTIELNTTHYRIPTKEQVDKWCAQVPADFRFCPKVPQRISHERNLGLGGDQLPLFWRSLEAFGDQLGCCFIQLPPYFSVDRLSQLDRWLELWPSAFPLAVELRHESWFANAAIVDEWTSCLHARKVASVITDVAGRRDVLHMAVTNDIAMIRFVGNGLHSSDYQRSEDWVRRVADWANKGVADIYFFPHQPDNLLAPAMASYLVKHINEHTTIQSRGPQRYDPASTRSTDGLVEGSSEGQQISLF